MTSSGLFNDIKKKPVILLAVIALHFALIVMLSINLSSSEVHKPASSNKKTVKAVMIDAEKIEAEAKKLKQVKIDKKKKELAQQRKIEKQQDKAKKQLAEIKKKQHAEKKRLADLKKKNQAEKKRIAEEKLRQEKLQREEDERRQAEAAELQRKLAEEERREAEVRQAKENDAKLQSLRSQYVRLIEQKVKRNWLRPATLTSEMSCEVIVTQTSLGDVVDVRLKKCVNDLAFQRSIERAVRKASPLPPPPVPEVFDREIHFTFKPRN